jgi:hypothetical protein
MPFFNDLENPTVNLLNEDFFFSKNITMKTINLSGLEWCVDGNLSSRGPSASMSTAFRKDGFCIENLCLKVNFYGIPIHIF